MREMRARDKPLAPMIVEELHVSKTNSGELILISCRTHMVRKSVVVLKMCQCPTN